MCEKQFRLELFYFLLDIEFNVLYNLCVFKTLIRHSMNAILGQRRNPWLKGFDKKVFRIHLGVRVKTSSVSYGYHDNKVRLDEAGWYHGIFSFLYRLFFMKKKTINKERIIYGTN